MFGESKYYDQADRKGPKIFVGEWATREGSPTSNFGAAMGDAAFMTGLERNSDIVVMASYAPLFVNVNPSGMQWSSDLMGYDALTTYGSPSYYAQVMFSSMHGDEILATDSQNIPTREWQPRGARGGNPPPPRQIHEVFFDATRDSKNGTLLLKVVNTTGTAQHIKVQITGARSVNS